MEDDRQPKWCARCRCFHAWTPPWPEVEAQIIAAVVQEMADQIDREILEELLAENRKEPTIGHE